MGRNLISCDWGTTNLRVKIVDRSSGVVTDQVESDVGVAKVYGQWLEGRDEGRIDFYLDRLESVIQELNHHDESLAEVPIVISGMASSSIGMFELPYSETPCSLNGGDLIIHKIDPTPSFHHPIWLISGLRHADDVLRGEETQLVGLAQLESCDVSNSLVILPGTHSKHVDVINNTIQGFRTYMTGELFEVISRHTILRDSVEESGGTLSDNQREAFEEGVTLAQTTSLANSLFKVRTSQLFGRYNSQQNYYFLSGQLIGAELSEIENSKPIVFSGGGRINQLYKIAADILGISRNSCFVPESEAQNVATHGHLALFERLS